jgi:hypothetical protein
MGTNEGNGYSYRAWAPAVAWGVAAYVVHHVGNPHLYLAFGWYQNLTHAWSASALAALAAVAGLGLGYRRRSLVAFVVAVTTGGAIGWEAVEYFGLLDGFGIPLHFHDFNDAAVDMLSNAVGVSFTLTAVWLLTGLGTEPRVDLDRWRDRFRGDENETPLEKI